MLKESDADETKADSAPEPDEEAQSSGDEGSGDRAEQRRLRRWTLLREHRRLHFLRAVLVGLLAGILAVLFQEALYRAENLRIGLLTALHGFPLWGWIAFPIIAGAAGAAAGWLTSTYSRSAAGSGIPHVKAVLLQLRPLRWWRLLPVKFIGGVLAIGAGFSLGREGPTVQMGAAAGKMVSSLLRVPRRSRSQLVAAGAGAGLAAAFNAPLAGFIFVIEELQREMSAVTYGTALIAAVVGDIVTRSITGQLPSFHITGYPTPPLTALPLFAVLGLVCGVIGVYFNRGLLGTLRFFHGWTKLPAWGRPAIVGCVVGLTAWLMPSAVGGGHRVAETILSGNAASLFHGPDVLPRLVGFLLLLFAVKFILTLICYGSGVPGGIFAPLLVLGALVGTVIGSLGAHWFPSVIRSSAAFGVIGMAAMFAAVIRAPLTGIVLILEMTGNYQQLFALLVASLIAYLVADHLRNKPVYESLLEYDLQRGGEWQTTANEPVLMDVVVEPHSAMDGKEVRALRLPKGSLLVTINRGGRELVPGGDARLQPGDHLTVIVSGNTPQSCALIQDRARSV